MKIAFITEITGQDGAYLTELLLAKGYEIPISSTEMVLPRFSCRSLRLLLTPRKTWNNTSSACWSRSMRISNSSLSTSVPPTRPWISSENSKTGSTNGSVNQTRKFTTITNKASIYPMVFSFIPGCRYCSEPPMLLRLKNTGELSYCTGRHNS